jgi:3-dehydroquinate dehydratase
MTLILQDKWQKQLAPVDDHYYKMLYQAYLNNQLTELEDISLFASTGKLTALRQAKNHAGHRLIICFYHNTTEETIMPTFTATLPTSESTAVTIPNLTLAPGEATLWTVIFTAPTTAFTDGWLVSSN